MSTLAQSSPIDPMELRPLINQRLDEATPVELEAVHHMLVELEARRLLSELDEATDTAWANGRISDEFIAQHLTSSPAT